MKLGQSQAALEIKRAEKRGVAIFAQPSDLASRQADKQTVVLYLARC